jgi:hypothetical protein
MAGSQQLQSAEYFEDAEEAGDGEFGGAQDSGQKRRPVDSWERTSWWISVVIAVTVTICVILVSVPYLSNLKSGAPTNPLDWWLRFGGAQSGQTFDKFLLDSAKKNKEDWEERYRQSPAYQLKDMQPFQMNMNPNPLGS